MDKLFFIITDLGPHVQLRHFAVSSRAAFADLILSHCTCSGKQRLAALKPDFSNLADLAAMYGWNYAASPPELQYKPSFWIERDATGCFVLFSKTTGCKIELACSLDPPPKLVYNANGSYAVVQFGIRSECDFIMNNHDTYSDIISKAKTLAVTST